MIKNFKSIKNFGIFRDFLWKNEVCGNGGSVENFKDINVLYGRNYSGKTTLSRILRAMETGVISDKFGSPSFEVAFKDGKVATSDNLNKSEKSIRVFNEDFIRDNLRFIVDPDDDIEPFAILGDDNNKIEAEIKALEDELGSKEEGSETGLYATLIQAQKSLDNAEKHCRDAERDLNRKLQKKATDREIGIKYKPEYFGDQNYNIRKLQEDIEKVLDANYRRLDKKKVKECEKLITEKTLQPIPSFPRPSLSLQTLINETETLVTKKVGDSDKIEELVKDAVLNHWVGEGRKLHKNKRNYCAFCGNPITKDRWIQLDKHFDEESERLEGEIDSLIERVTQEKNRISTSLSINKSLFYSRFHDEIDGLISRLDTAIRNYCKSLDILKNQLESRKGDILSHKEFDKPDDPSSTLISVWDAYERVREASNKFSSSLITEQAKAKEALRLREVSDYLITIQYSEQISSIEKLKKGLQQARQIKSQIKAAVRQKEGLIASKKRELNDEEKGAKKVNQYLNDSFGHQFLSLEAREDDDTEGDSKRVRFEVIRNGKRAYHLSEGECSLLAFCYFLAKLDDIDTRNSKPIIWIDDPISSLDGNHVFFVYSLISTEIVSRKKFGQLFISTHNLEFLKYLKRLNLKRPNTNQNELQKDYFMVERQGERSTIKVMPKYLKEYITEFNYLFHQIYKCASIDIIDDENHVIFYNFGNNARKFLEIYLYYKYPDRGMCGETLRLFFDDAIPAILTDRINNEYSHLSGVFERGSTPVEVPEMQAAAKKIIERLKLDREQYSALLQSVGEIADTGTQKEGIA